jgi:hypothetical protein
LEKEEKEREEDINMQKIKQELEASKPQTALTKKSSWIKKINQEKVERRERIEKEKRDKEE